MFDDVKHRLRITIFTIAFGAASLAHAQSSIPPEQAKAFVRASLAVSQIVDEWQLRINRAKSEGEAERLRERANHAMGNAIRETDGITIDEYRATYYAAKRDAELAAYLVDLLEQEVAER